MGFMIGALIPAAIAVAVTWNREGGRLQILACLLSLALSGGLAFWLAYRSEPDPDFGVDPILWFNVIVSVIVTAVWRTRTFLKSRAQNDLRNQ